MSEYILLKVTPPAGKERGCISHKDIPVEHLFGNPNWQMDKIDDYYIKFTCMQCGEVRLFQRVTERTLLTIL